MAYKDLTTEEDVTRFRAEAEKRKADEQKNAEETARAEALAASKAARVELESTLETRFLAAGGTKSEWLSVRRQTVQDALIRVTLSPEPEQEKPRADAPLSRNQYMDR